MSGILEKTEAFATDLLSNKLDANFLYHNLRHTQRVVNRATEIINASELNDAEKEIILLAAWLHDTGYIKGSENHEETSVEIAKNFLSEVGLAKENIKEVVQCILATKRFHHPTTFSQEILRDADASHLSQNSYPETCELLREELALFDIAHFSPKEWLETNIKMFRSEHRYFTNYAKINWQPGKDKNLRRLIKEKKSDKELAKRERLKAKYKNESPDRGIQTLFRVTLKNHLTLSDIADTKSNILLSVNAIIISVVLSNLIPKLDNPSNSHLIYPTVIFVIFTTASMILAVLATRPNVTSGKFTKKDVENKKVNLLFFGNFHKMTLNDYEWAIQELVKDKDYIYSSLTKDLYFLGLVLNRKYKLLRYTYTIFIIGIILSVLAFGFAFRFFGKGRLEDVAQLGF